MTSVWRGTYRFDRPEADLGGDDVRHLRLDHAADRIRPVPVGAFARLAGEAAEDDVETDLVGPHEIDAGAEPDQDQEQTAEEEPTSADITAGDQILQPVLTAPQDFLEIGRVAIAPAAA